MNNKGQRNSQTYLLGLAIFIIGLFFVMLYMNAVLNYQLIGGSAPYDIDSIDLTRGWFNLILGMILSLIGVTIIHNS